jgi:hypothetical protein
MTTTQRNPAAESVTLPLPLKGRFPSGIVSFVYPMAEKIGASLEYAVVVWPGDGCVRTSVHLHSDSADIARFPRHLEPILSQFEQAHD